MMQEYVVSARILDSFWGNYPDSTSGISQVALIEKAERDVLAALGPQPDTMLVAPGAEALLWATLSSVTLSKSTDPVTEAYNAADKAYFAVFKCFARAQTVVGTRQMREVEALTSECKAEIGFQLTYLGRIESYNGAPPHYSTILGQLDQ